MSEKDNCKCKCKRESEKLVVDIYRFINLLDVEMKKPSSVDRGRNIAKLSNFLEFETDRFAHLNLNLGFKKISNLKNRNKSS